MTPARSTTLGLAALAAAALCAGVAAVALANVVVYTNNFSKRPDVRQMAKAGGGKQCRRVYVANSNRMRVVARSGPRTCGFRPPVQSDGELPNHVFSVNGRIPRGNPQGARASAFLFARVRAGGGTGYELRVYPRGGRFELARDPDSGAFPVTGRDEAINGFGQLNRMRLAAIGAEVRAFVNGKHLATVTDRNPGALTGTRLHFGAGHERRTQNNFHAAFDRLRLAVPRP